jgi:MFS family permease
VLAACVLGNMLSFTPVVTVTFGLFLLPMAAEFHWPRARLSGALTLVSFLTAIIYPWLGRLADRVGARRLIVWGSLALGLAILALAFAGPNVLLFYGLFAAAGIAGTLPSTLLMNRVISEWFDKTRGAMLGVAAGIGNGVGTSLMPIIAAMLMAWFGWRGAYLGLGALVLLISFPVLATLLREAPRAAPGDAAAASASPGVSPDLAHGLSLGDAARTGRFWRVLCAIALAAGCMGAAASRVIPILTDRGFSVALGTAVISVFALVCAAGQVVIGGLLDRTRSPRMAGAFFVASVGGVLLLQHAATAPLLIVAGALLGLGIGAEYSILPYVISRYFGMKHFGAIAGVMYGAVMLAGGVTPLLMDLVFDASKSYAPAMLTVQAGLLLAAALLASLPAYARPAFPSVNVQPVK